MLKNPELVICTSKLSLALCLISYLIGLTRSATPRDREKLPPKNFYSIHPGHLLASF